jgi:hypothetical protein
MPTAILYSGPGVELERDEPRGGVVCMREVAEQAGFTVRTLFVDQPLTGEDLLNADVWLTPAAEEKGRNNYGRYSSNIAISHYMGDKGYTPLLKAAIQSGLGYLGCCAGAYWATNDLDLQLAGPDVYAWETKTQYHEDIIISSSNSDDLTYTMDLLDGPYFALSNTLPNVEIVGRYKTPPSSRSDVAMIATQCGNGFVFLSGPHPEADLSWAQDASWQDSAENVERNRAFLADRMRRVQRLRDVSLPAGNDT